MPHHVLIALATRDFDPTEVAVPWHTFKQAGHEVSFATVDGGPATCDMLMLEGVVFGQIGATANNVALYRELEQDPAFRAPRTYADIDPHRFDALILPGGHAPPMRQYLEDETLQERVAGWLKADKPLGAICHGGVVLARAKDPDTGAPAIAGRRLTALTKTLELSAWLLTVATHGSYFRTYPQTVEAEVRAALGVGGRFERGPMIPSYSAPFVVVDGNLVTARWPGDAQGFADALVGLLEGWIPHPGA